MFSTSLSIRHLQSGGIITNYFCTAQCRHCLYCCSPQWPKEYIDAATAYENFRAVRKLGCTSVHLGGGEPFLRPSELLAVLEASKEAGVTVDYVETNASWFVDETEGLELLRQCRSAGLTTVLVSISPFHNETIPFSKTRKLLEALSVARLRAFPWVEDFCRDLETLGADRPHRLEETARVFGHDYLRRIPRRYWIHFGGRAVVFFGNVFGKKPASSILEANPWPCTELGDVTHFHLDLYGRYIPGLCTGLGIFREDLGGSLPKGRYRLIERLYSKGIRGLYDLAVTDHGYVPSRSFLNKCDLCLDIRRHLIETSPGRYVELHPATFYQEWAGTVANDGPLSTEGI